MIYPKGQTGRMGPSWHPHTKDMITHDKKIQKYSYSFVNLSKEELVCIQVILPRNVKIEKHMHNLPSEYFFAART